MRPQILKFSEDIPAMLTAGPAKSLPYHWHKALEVIKVTEGYLHLTLSGTYHPLEPGDIAVVNVNQPHLVRCPDGGAQLLLIHIDPTFCEAVDLNFKHAFFRCCSHCDREYPSSKYAVLQEHLRRITYELQAGYQRDLGAALSSYLRAFVIFLMREFDYIRFGAGYEPFDERHVKRFRSIYALIRGTPSNRRGLGSVAKAAGVGLQHMSNDIKDRFGRSYLELVHCLRCEEAARLLLGTNLRIADISYQCGFSDPKYLVKHFRLNYGSTPSRFRDLHKACDILESMPAASDSDRRGQSQGQWAVEAPIGSASLDVADKADKAPRISKTATARETCSAAVIPRGTILR